jgi:hypothetical protein
MRELIKRIIRHSSKPFLDAFAESDFMDRSILLQGAQAAFCVGAIACIPSLSAVGFRVFSQFDEDGILEWLVSRLPGIPPTFVEFGVEDYREANTRFLLRHRNWRGLVMDGSTANMERTRATPRYWQNDLTTVSAFIDRENINGLIAGNGFAGEIGILSIDLDGNDYWVWRALDAVNPWMVVIEYNAVFGDLVPLSIPYDAQFRRNNAHSSNLYWGAGIGALEHLAEERGYVLLGSNLAGNNAFFLRADLMANFQGEIADRTARPSLYRESRGADGNLSYIRGSARRETIADMPVVDVSIGKTIRLGDAGNIYSQHWAEAMGA